MSTPQVRLRNIGPKSAAWLRQVGLRTRDDLAAAGTLDAFMRVKRAGFKPGLNLLYAIEGALNDCHWQEVPEARRVELVAAATARPPRRRAGHDHHAHVGGRRRIRSAAGRRRQPVVRALVGATSVAIRPLRHRD